MESRASVSHAFSAAVDKQVEYFLESVRKATDITSHMVVGYRPPAFPILGIANDEYYEYNRFELILEWYTRERLVNPLLKELFYMKGIESLWPEVEKKYPASSNQAFEDRIQFEFIIEQSGKTIGYRYTDIFADDDELLELLQTHNLSNVGIVHWTDDVDKVSRKVSWGISPNYRNLVRHVTVRQLFDDCFLKEESDLLVEKLQDAVKKANDMVGFQTIPSLSLRYLSQFKERLLIKMGQRSLHEGFFLPADEFEASFGRLSDDDIKLIDKSFFNLGLYKALIGNESFAKCFLTAEYLSQVFKEGGEFDFTSVACGYFKAVEQLAYTLMNMTLRTNHGPLWIKKNNVRIDGNVEIELKTPYRMRRGEHVLFEEGNARYFDTSLGSLSNFLHENKCAWGSMTDQGRHFVLARLRDYTKHYRNGYFHKDNIEKLEDLGVIRSNTLFVMYLLIGGYNPCADISERKAALGITDNLYDVLYSRLAPIPRSVKNFKIQFGDDDPIDVVRLYDQDDTAYDENGNVITKLRFARVGTYQIEDYGAFLDALDSDDLIEIDRTNIPTKIWVQAREGFKEVGE